MMKDLEEMQELIRGNDDIKDVTSLVKDTSSHIQEHGKAFEKLRRKIQQINNDAESAMSQLDFYGVVDSDPDSDPEINELLRKKKNDKQARKKKYDDLEVILDNPNEDEQPI